MKRPVKTVLTTAALLIASLFVTGTEVQAQGGSHMGFVSGSPAEMPGAAPSTPFIDPEGGIAKPVPEPVTMSLLGIGGVGLVVASRRRRRERDVQA